MRKLKEDRITKAKEVIGKPSKSKCEVLKIINDAIAGKINGEAKIVKLSEIKKLEIPIMQKDKKAGFIFVQFAKCGHVAVVGGGNDYVRNPVYCGKGSTALIMKHMRNLNEENCREDFEFDVDSIIAIPIEDLESTGFNKASAILKCRNGVEQYIGESLEANGVEIINYYQHKNFNKTIKELMEQTNVTTKQKKRLK